MGQAASDNPAVELLDKILGHLNFSSGQHDPKFVANLDQVFRNHLAAATLCREQPTGDEEKPAAEPPAKKAPSSCFANRPRC